MNVSQLQYIVEIYEQKSLSKASEKLYITPQALSLSIKSMENELGIQILEKIKGVQFSEQGKLFVQYAYNILDEWTEFLMRIKTGNSCDCTQLPGELCLLVNDKNYSVYLFKAIQEFKKHFPKIRISIAEKNMQDIYKCLNEEKSEKENIMAFVIIPDLLKHDKEHINNCYFKKTKRSRYKFFVYKDSKFANYKQLSLSSILSDEIIQYNIKDKENFPLFKLFRRYNYDFENIEINYNFDSASLCFEAIKHNFGGSFFIDDFLTTGYFDKKNFYSQGVVPIEIKEHMDVDCGYLYSQKTTIIEESFLRFLGRNAC